MKINTKKTLGFNGVEVMVISTLLMLLISTVPIFRHAKESNEYINRHRNNHVESPSQSDLIAEQNRLLMTLIEQNNRR